jgi:Na+-translocating ferredoxin:NAD+ oxidoreductase RNF subunit RnfB
MSCCLQISVTPLIFIITLIFEIKILFVIVSVGFAVVALCATALFFSLLIYVVDRRFKVTEDPLIDEIQDLLPGVNCGGCGYAGCRQFAVALVESRSFKDLYCPVGGNKLVGELSPILEIEAVSFDPTIAVVRCNGTPRNAPQKVVYDGVKNCYIAASVFTGESGCPYSCLGFGDCVSSCNFDAMRMDEISRLPVVLEDQCVSCGLCVKACPRHIIELRPKGPENKRIYVNCINREKGAVAIKNCAVACIGCAACIKACRYDAITMDHHLALIDAEKCSLCGDCIPVCPTKAIAGINVPATF